MTLNLILAFFIGALFACIVILIAKAISKRELILPEYLLSEYRENLSEEYRRIHFKKPTKD